MSLKEHIYSALVVSSSEKFNTAMASMLPRASFKPVVYAKNISMAQRAAAERDYDIVIVDAPLSDDLGVRFAIDTSTSSSSLVLVLISNEIHDDVYEKVSPYGVFTLAKPMTVQAMNTALRWIKAAKEKMSGVEKKSTKIEDKMLEIRLVNKAKWLLISHEDMLEPEAHRYLEKEAMDRCVSKKQIAEEIIKKYK